VIVRNDTVIEGILYSAYIAPMNGVNNNIKVSLIGGTGYGGAEILRHLLYHPHVEVIRVSAADHIGQRVDQVHHNLLGQTDLLFESCTPTEAAEGADVVFLGVPHCIAATLVPELVSAGVRIVDLSGDFRLRNRQVYEQYYDTVHAAPELIGSFVYGLPELNREAIKGARYVASPGCFATTIALALLPAAQNGLISGKRVRVVAMTGSSGSGQTPKIGTHHPLRVTNLKADRPLNHQHTPEIEQTLADAGGRDMRLDFVPVSAPLQRGILAVAFVEVDGGFDTAKARSLQEAYYRDEPFIRLPIGRLPEVNAIKGSMYVEIGGHVADGTWVCMTAIDNLVKGGAGQAIQSFNIMCGFDETLGLSAPPLWP
jgi:N-acetyl-gamma-glutamyl-phosphate reductase